MAEETNEKIDQLTPGQIECLLLVHEHLTSKEIGPRLGISPHTVDQRVRTALRTLGCKRRFQAAKLVASRRSLEDVFLLQRDGTEPFVKRDAEPLKRKSSKSIPLPFTTPDHPTNEMSVAFRLFWIVAIASASAFSAGMYLAGLESLSRLIQS